MARIDIQIPDLGDFKDVAVAEVFIKPGDDIVAEQPIIAVESDKATMDIPSPFAGKVVAVSISIGAKVNKGDIVAALEVAGQAEQTQDNPPLQDVTAAHPASPSGSSHADETIDLVVIGGGPGGYSAAFRAADLGMQVALVERDDVLGGVCLNVGCIPSKALLHVAAVLEEAQHLSAHGVTFGAPQIDLDQLRTFKEQTVSRLTGGLAAMARMRKVERITGTARFDGPHHLLVTNSEGTRRIGFKQCIIAAGSSPVALPFLPADERIVNSTGALALRSVPQRMLVIGGGIIGLEMATVYSALGARIDVVEQAEGLLTGVDRDLVAIWQKRNASRFDRVLSSTKVEAAHGTDAGIEVSFSGDNAIGIYDLVLQAAGRRGNADALALETAGLLSERGGVSVDRQMRTAVPHIFAIGDIVGQPMLAHKAMHEGHVAAEAAAGLKCHFDATVIPSVAYLDPEIAWVGVTEDSAVAQGIAVKVARFPWGASGRAIANGADYGVTKLIFSQETGRILGGAIVGPSAGDMIGEICLAIEMGADAIDIGKTIHPHPTLGETIGMTAEVAKGTCTDLPPSR